MRDNDKNKLYENIKQEIRSLLISSPKTKYGGLSGSLLYFDYKQLNSGKEVPYVELGFHSFLALLRSMPDVVRIEYRENSSSYRVHPIYDQTTAHIQKMVFEQRDKYQYKNQLYNQNWHSNKKIPLNFYNNDQLPFLHNSLSYRTFNNVQTNFSNSSHHKVNNSFRRSFPQELFISNKGKEESYLLLTPSNHQKKDEKINFHDFNLLPNLSSKSIDDHDICSTPNTFIETPSKFDFDDYHLNKSIKIINKDIHEENNNNSSINNQIEEINDDPLLTTSINIIPNLERDQSLTSPSISPTNILPTIIDDTSNKSEFQVEQSSSIIEEKKSQLNNEIFFEIYHCNEQEQSKINENKNLLKRLNNAIRECIHFRYIHRLYELKFEYRYYPLSIETLLIKSKLEKLAFKEFKQELEEFEKLSQLNSFINDQICQTMFDEYIYLQRNYYYMIKLMKKKPTIN